MMSDQAPAAKTPLPPAVKFVLGTMVVNAMGFGIIVPVVPNLVMELGGGGIAHATAMGGWLSFVFAAFQFICSPIVGNLSDRFGRRPVLLCSLLGFALDFLALALAPTLVWLFIARAVSGMFGATNGPAQSVIADVTPPEARSRLFGFIGAAFGIGFVLGPALGGLLGEFGHRLPFYAASLLASANFLYGLFFLPETLKPENRRAFEWKRANPVGSLLTVRKLPGIVPISITYFLWQLATLVYPMIWSYYAIWRYGWSNGLVGASLALMGVAMAVTQMVIAPRIVPRLGERKTAILGGCATIFCMGLLGIVSSGWVAFLMMPLIAAQSLVHPNLTAMMSRRASKTNQGEVQGFASSVMAVGSILAPLLYNPLEALFSGQHPPFELPGAAFFASATIAALAILNLWRLAPAPITDPVLAAKDLARGPAAGTG
jgi:MFS transporter, DHA1 family, tetracycline resistance protein